MTQDSASKAFSVIFFMSLLLGIGATRMDARDAELSEDVSDEAGGVATNSSGSSWSPWEIKYEGLSCTSIDLSPFPGLRTSWPSCAQAAEEKGNELALKRNCKACDVTFAGSKPEAETGMKSTKCSALVKCSSGRVEPSQGCFTINGPVGKVERMNSKASEREEHPNRACFPCPPECKTCIFDDSYTNWAMGKKSFKCIMAGGASGATCTKPAGIECGECTHRRCGGTRLWSSCDNNDFKADCKWPAEYQIPSNAMDRAVDDELRDYKMTMGGGRDSRVMPPVLEMMTKS